MHRRETAIVKEVVAQLLPRTTTGRTHLRVKVVKANYIGAAIEQLFLLGKPRFNPSLRVTRGAVNRLSRPRLEAVIAHELAHLDARDNQRGTDEYRRDYDAIEARADARAIELCGNGPALAGAIIETLADLKDPKARAYGIVRLHRVAQAMVE